MAEDEALFGRIENMASHLEWGGTGEHARMPSRGELDDAADLRAILSIARAYEDPQPYKDALDDLLFCRGEQEAIGGGPGWQERDRKAWAAAEELMRVEE